MARRMTGRQLHDRLDSLGYTQIGFAAAIGVNPRTVRHWVAGSYPVPIVVALLVSLMAKCKVRIDEIK